MANEKLDYGTFKAAKERSLQLEKEIIVNPDKFLVLTGDRPTGHLHVGHLFGSLQNRVRLQNLGVPTAIVIADYQVLTDRDVLGNISESVIQLTIDYLSAGLDPENGKTFIFPHSYIPELNQLLLPFLSLVSMSELNRNPTVKEEISASGLKNISAAMYTYPVHQAADILFCKANLVPVGKDQLPHLELSRVIARRFNTKFANNQIIFPEPEALLSNAAVILGLDGNQKMSKSRNNAILLSDSEDETAALIKKAKSDSVRLITYDPIHRPEVANLLLLISLCTQKTPEEIADTISEGGATKLKAVLTEVLNEYLRPLRLKRKEIEKNPNYVKAILLKGIDKARSIAQKTLDQVRTVMNMSL